ncbi:MAG: UDP-N-acetylmuramoyl-L-alanyl-D-glutamate--2,6-diaminopimelate ligase [Bacteroidales bacterium]|nr:UDP-N-acetylmuramoyl-L-alanyl-D-glutamate--2,6-diaminopimelate ligase [Bacteroidales bacterium]
MEKLLTTILLKSPVKQIVGNPDVKISSIAFDSRKVTAGNVFVAVSGRTTNGHVFIEKAIEAGAIAVVCEQLPEMQHSSVTYVVVENAAFALAFMSAAFYNYPSENLKLIGVTGTNGKTTIATLLYRLFSQCGYPSGLLSTIENRIDTKVVASTHTTPDALSINALLAEMVDHGCTYAFMEVSSHALDQFRVAGLRFEGGIFTNLTHDHLDYHGSFAHYRDTKKLLFDMLGAHAFALVNQDDRNGQFMLQNTKASKFTFGLNTDADFRAKLIENRFEGLVMQIDGQDLFTCMTGKFNASNLLAVYAASVLAGLDKSEALRGISALTSAEGRFEVMKSPEGIIGIVDYAHTPDALLNVLETINEIRTHNELLITVTGAGGDRDRTKRPEMAKVAAKLSNKLILTSDNPRSENPESIILDMRKGVEPQYYSRTLAITNRHEAIKAAVAMARSGDIILVAGKGHEKYQEIDGVKYPFDDKKELFELLAKH